MLWLCCFGKNYQKTILAAGALPAKVASERNSRCQPAVSLCRFYMFLLIWRFDSLFRAYCWWSLFIKERLHFFAICYFSLNVYKIEPWNYMRDSALWRSPSDTGCSVMFCRTVTTNRSLFWCRTHARQCKKMNSSHCYCNTADVNTFMLQCSVCKRYFHTGNRCSTLRSPCSTDASVGSVGFVSLYCCRMSEKWSTQQPDWRSVLQAYLRTMLPRQRGNLRAPQDAVVGDVVGGWPMSFKLSV